MGSFALHYGDVLAADSVTAMVLYCDEESHHWLAVCLDDTDPSAVIGYHTGQVFDLAEVTWPGSWTRVEETT